MIKIPNINKTVTIIIANHAPVPAAFTAFLGMEIKATAVNVNRMIKKICLFVTMPFRKSLLTNQILFYSIQVVY